MARTAAVFFTIQLTSLRGVLLSKTLLPSALFLRALPREYPGGSKSWIFMGALLGFPVGLLLGVVIHRGDFCMHSAVREALAGRRGPQVRAYLAALGFLLLTVNGLAAFGVLTLSLPEVTPAASIVGGVMFGVGMVAGKG